MQVVALHAVLSLACVLVFPGCDSGYPYKGRERHMGSIESGALKPYLSALAVDRAAMGFPPLPTSGEVTIDTVDRTVWDAKYPPPAYDVYLHFYDDPPDYRRKAHGVALKKVGNGFQWVHEQVTFDGPKTHIVDPDNGPSQEYVCLLRETEQIGVQGANIQGTLVTYSGPEPKFRRQIGTDSTLKASDVAPLIRNWGYDY